MPIPTNKSELLLAITDTYEKLKVDLGSIPSDLTNIKELPGHAKNTTMTVSNVVAYLIGWGELVLKWHAKKSNNEHVDFPETGYKWNELGQLAQKFYTDYDHLAYEQLLKHLDDTVGKLVSVINDTPAEFLYGKPWYEKYTMGRMIQLNTSSPYKNARTRIRKWKRSRSL